LYKKVYLIITVFLVIGGGILTWMIFYGDFQHNSPVRAKQVFNISPMSDSLLSSSKNFYRYNTNDNVQTISEATTFN